MFIFCPRMISRTCLLKYPLRLKIPRSKLSLLKVQVTGSSIVKNTFVCMALCCGGDVLAQVSILL